MLRRSPFTGLQLIFIFLAAQALVLTFSLLYAQSGVPELLLQGLQFPESAMSAIIRVGLYPSTNGWVIQNVLSAAFFAITFAILAFLWQIIRARDYRDLENIQAEVESRSALLGMRDSTILRGETTLGPARKVSALFVALIIINIAFCSFTAISNSIPFRMIGFFIGVLGASIALYLFSFCLFFWFHYRPVLLILSTTLTVVQGFVTAAMLVVFTLFRFVLSYHTPGFANNASIMGYIGVASGGAQLLLSLITVIFSVRYITWASPILAGDINSFMQKHLDGLYEYRD